MQKTMLPIGAPVLTRSELKPWSKFEKNTIVGKQMLNQDFKEFIQSLNDNDVRYLVVGGYIDLEDLKTNKAASGRFQDLADLENLQ